MDPETPEFTNLDKEFLNLYAEFILGGYKRFCIEEDVERLYAELRNPHCTHGRHRKSCYQCNPPIGSWSTGYPK